MFFRGIFMNALLALEVIEQLEVNLGDMYAKLQSSFTGNKDLEPLFHRLHLDELDHVNLVRMQRRIVQAKQSDFGEVHLNFTDFYKALHRVTVILAMPRDKINEILVQCYLVESSLVEQYVVAALKDANPEMSQLLEMLGQGFRDHLAALAVCVKDVGADPANLESIRISPRVSFSGGVMVNNKSYAKGVDISESGIFLLTKQTFPEDRTIMLSFSIGNDVVNARAVVQYSVPNAGIGLLFDELSAQHRSLIRAYVDDALQVISNESKRKKNDPEDERSGTA